MIKPQEYYTAECDNCGEAWSDDHHGWSAMSDVDSLKEYMSNGDWHFGDGKEGEDGKTYCSTCWRRDDEDNFHLINIEKKK